MPSHPKHEPFETVMLIERCRGCGHDLLMHSGGDRHNIRCAIDGERSYASARTQQETED